MIKQYQNKTPGFWCTICQVKHRSVFYHTELIEAQMKIDRQAIIFGKEKIQQVTNDLRFLTFFTVFAVGLLTVWLLLQ